MRENEFERKVQAQMEELRIRPSDETWERVEKELREKKKRRAAILFFIMAGLLLLGYSGYTFLYKSSNTPVAQNEAAQKASSSENTQQTINTPTTTTSASNNNNSAVAEKSGTTPNTYQPDQNRNANPSLNQEAVKENPVAMQQAYPQVNRQLPAIGNTVESERMAIVKANSTDRRQKRNAIISQKENNPAISNPGETGIVKNSADPTEKEPVQQPADKKVDIISNDIASNTIINNKEQKPADSATATDSTIAKTEVDKTGTPVTEDPNPAIAATKNKPKWKLGVEVFGGVISSQNKVFAFIDGSGTKSRFDASSAITGGQNPGTNAPRPIPPSDVKAGKALKIGLVAEKTISKRSSISTGLRYSYADESLEVGAIRDTVIRSNSYSFSQNFLAVSGIRNAYNAAAQLRTPTKYTNRYHFLELPFLYQTQLNNGKKMGILWNAGIAPGFLIGTNALVYDTAARGIYYKNDNAFKRFHFNMQTGLALQFGTNKKIQWSVGPTFSLDMTRLMKEDVFTERRYFLYTGFTGRLFLNSRKK